MSESSVSVENKLLVEPRDALDEALREELEAAKGFSDEASRLLLPDSETVEREKRRFYESGMQAVPNLQPNGSWVNDLGAQDQALAQLRRKLKAELKTVPPDSQDPNSAVLRAYKWRVNELLAKNRMLRAAAEGDFGRFNRYNRFIFGEPKPEVFAATCDWFCEEAQTIIMDAASTPEAKAAAENVIDAIGHVEGTHAMLVPDTDAFEAVREDHMSENGYYGKLLGGVTLEVSKVTPSEGEPAIQQAQSNLGTNYSRAPHGWWSVAHSKQQLLGPETYNLPLERFIGLVLGHEIGSHMLEAINGLNSPVQLAGRGFDRYENTNEGRAIVREQVRYADFKAFSKLVRWKEILRRHLAISLASGLDGGRRYTFPEVYHVINAIDTMHQRRKNADTEAADQKAHAQTWKLLSRIYMGSDGKSGVFLKDKIYLEGNIAIWKMAEADPAAVNLGDLGKFDLTNPRHIQIAIQTGLLKETDIRY